MEEKPWKIAFMVMVILAITGIIFIFFINKYWSFYFFFLALILLCASLYLKKNEKRFQEYLKNLENKPPTVNKKAP